MTGLLRTIKKNRIVSLTAFFLFIIAALSIIGPFLSSCTYSEQDLKNTFLPPFSKGHIFGTDELGRDLFVRILFGIRISIAIGFFAALFQMFIGVIYGGIAGSLGGITDEILMRIVDIVYSIPYLIIVILLTVVMGNSELTLILALAVSDWTGMAKVIRAQTLQLKDMEFVQSAKVLGSSNLRILLKHIIPNCTGTIIVGLMFSIPAAVFSEAFLSFIGLGVRIPKASLGTLASDGYRYMDSHPALFLIPVAVIIVIMLLFNIIGDRIRDLSDPSYRRH